MIRTETTVRIKGDGIILIVKEGHNTNRDIITLQILFILLFIFQLILDSVLNFMFLLTPKFLFTYVLS